MRYVLLKTVRSDRFGDVREAVAEFDATPDHRGIGRWLVANGYWEAEGTTRPTDGGTLTDLVTDSGETGYVLFAGAD